MPKPETPLLTVDAVIIYEKTNLIFIRRKNPPFQGVLALPVDLLILERQLKMRVFEKPMKKQILT